MARPALFGPGLSFTTWPVQAKGERSGVVQLGRQAAGRAFMRKGCEQLVNEDQVASFMAQRIEATVTKLMFSAAQLYVEGHRYAPLHVEGATVRGGAGDSSWTSIGNKKYISGTEAAHFGIGTVTRGGEALSVLAARQVLIWRRTSGYPKGDPRGDFEANGALAGIGLECDASTFREPGFMNQSDGKLEGFKHKLLEAYAPRIIPASPELLQRFIHSKGAEVAERLLRDPWAVIGPLEKRHAILKSNTEDGYRQDPRDTENILLGGSERNYVGFLLDLHTNPNSKLHQDVGRLIGGLPARSEEFASTADQGREERVNAPTFEPSPSEAGGGGEDAS